MLVDRITYLLSMVSVHGAAAFLVLVFPLWMWRDGLKGKTLADRILFCLLTQTCFLVNLVLLLGFLRCCNRYTLLLGLLGEYLLVRWTISDRSFFARWNIRKQRLTQLLQGQMGFFELRQDLRTWFLFKCRRMRQLLFPRRPSFSQVMEALFLLAILGYNQWFLPHQVRLFHSYQFSDLPVHMSWIYGLDQGTLFVDGIYPFAMHAMCYVLQTLFPIVPREVILYYGSFQTLLTIFTLFLFAKQLFRWRYSPYLVLILWSILFNQGRYGASLPQESGVFAMYATGYFLLRMLQSNRRSFPIRSDGKLRAFFRINQYMSRFYLQFDFFMLTIAVSLVIAFHFYTAIATIVLAFSLVICAFGRFAKKQNYVPIVLAAVLGAVIAIAPFIACFATGTPFQESMAWAMSVINGETWEGTGSGYLESLEEETSTEAPAEETTTEVVAVYRRGLSASEMAREIFDAMQRFTTSAVLRPPIMLAIVLSALLSALLALPLLFSRRYRGYACGCYGVILYCLILSLMGASADLGLIVVLSSDRAPVFLEPALFLVLAMSMDLVFFWLGLWKNSIYQRMLGAISLALCIGTGVALVHFGFLHNFFDVNLAYYNEPDYLIYRIRQDCAPNSYTVVSPTDEYYAVVYDAYHYELSELMHQVDSTDDPIKIPTPHVFFFIEKYTMQDKLNGRMTVSEEFARKKFEYRASTQDYYYQRNIIESKAYYWAQAMASFYPARMRVYFENDIYIAYELIQDPNVPLDLNIPYLDLED